MIELIIILFQYIRDMDALHYMNSEAYGVRTHIQRTHWTSDVEQTHLVVDSRKTTCMLYLQADHLLYVCISVLKILRFRTIKLIFFLKLKN